jgi:hypothetical protein
MEGRGVLGELVKYVLTGVLSFIAALGYTEWRLKPGRNVSLVPLAMERHDTCKVNFDELRSKTPTANTNVSQEDDYTLYLKALIKDSGQGVLLKKIVPTQLLPRLEEDKILSCERPDPDHSPDILKNTILIVHVAVLLNDPTAYVFTRSCSLDLPESKAEKKPIPLRASIEEIPLSAPATIKTDPVILVIEKTRVLILHYDLRDADNAPQNKFTELVKKMDKGKVDVILTCSVIHSDGEEPIGRLKPYHVSVRTSI